MSINKQKYTQAVLYFLHNTDQDLMTKTKLCKLLYYLDFDHYEKYERSVTNDVYRKLDHGPVGSRASDIIDEMKKNEFLKEIIISYPPPSAAKGYTYIPQREFDSSAFSSSEMEILSSVADRFSKFTKSQIESATHGEAPWLAVEMNEIIPYELSFYRNSFEKNGSNVDY